MSFQERREFDKYLKFLTAKVAQTVVQSRQGSRIKTRSVANGNDWFNLAIQDDKQVSVELKRSLEGKLPDQDQPVSIEIEMTTADGDSLVLEVWNISLDHSSRDISVSIKQVLYSRLCLMVKSVIALSRTTPAYRYSRKTEDDNKFTFRVYSGHPDIPNYHKDFKHVKFASTSCLYGTISISLSYRTSITFNQDRSVSDPFMLNRQFSAPLDGNIENGSLHSLSMPFASEHHPPPHKGPTGHPFSSVLPREVVERQESGGTVTGDDDVVLARRDSLPISREPEGFVLVDMGEIKPAFVSRSSTDDLTEFLQQCKEEPNLDMFSGEESMDVAAALKLVDSHSVEDQT